MAVKPEVAVKLRDVVGSLAAALERLSDVRVAVDAWHLAADGTLRLVCDNPHLVVDLLGPDTRVTDVLVTNVAVRDVSRVLKCCAAHGVSINYAYTGPGDAPGRLLAVLGVADPARAAVQLGF